MDLLKMHSKGVSVGYLYSEDKILAADKVSSVSSILIQTRSLLLLKLWECLSLAFEA